MTISLTATRVPFRRRPNTYGRVVQCDATRWFIGCMWLGLSVTVTADWRERR